MRLVVCMIIIVTIIFSISCKKEDGLKLVPSHVIVKMKEHYPLHQAFDLINSLGHDVKNIHSLGFKTAIPRDSLQDVIDYINSKPYTNDGITWFAKAHTFDDVEGSIISLRLFNMHNKVYQEDWFETMSKLGLHQVGSYIVFFLVPEGKEKVWVEKFQEYEFVEWAELNYYFQGSLN